MMLKPGSVPPATANVPDFLERRLEADRASSELTPEAQAVLDRVFDDQSPVEWSEEDIVFLHWKMLEQLTDLAQPATPLAEKIDILRWVFTDPECDDQPFSFSSCVRVVTLSPLSPIAYCGLTDADEIRGWIRRHARIWLAATLERYPAWVRQAVLDDPRRIESHLARNPQWLNEQVKKHGVEGDLFA